MSAIGGNVRPKSSEEFRANFAFTYTADSFEFGKEIIPRGAPKRITLSDINVDT